MLLPKTAVGRMKVPCDHGSCISKILPGKYVLIPEYFYELIIKLFCPRKPVFIIR